MAHTKPPPLKRKTLAPKTLAPKGDARLEACLEETAKLRHEVKALRTDVSHLRAVIAQLIKRNKHPPPLPPDGAGEGEDVIHVDERDVVLESIRPSRLKR